MKTLLALAFACLVSATASAAVINVEVMAGQSPCVGNANPVYTEAPADLVVRLYPELGTIDATEDDFTVSEYPAGADPAAPRWLQGVIPTAHDLAPVMFGGVLRAGPEITYGRLIYIHFGASYNTTIAKFCIGASSLNRHWIVSPTVDLADRLVVFLSQLRKQIEANGDQFVMRSFNWNQGQSDTRFQADADRYAQNLVVLAGKVRGFANNPKLPITVVRTYINMPALSAQERAIRSAPLATVRAAQEDLAASDPCAAFVNSDNLAYQDAFHLTSQAISTQGQRIYVARMNIAARAECQ